MKRGETLLLTISGQKTGHPDLLVNTEMLENDPLWNVLSFINDSLSIVKIMREE